MGERRRTKGTGSVYQRQSDGLWAATITLEGGARKTYYANTRKAAQAKLDDALYEQRTGRLIAGPSQTLTNYLQTWLEDSVRLRVKRATYENYVSHMTHVADSRLGSMMLGRIKPAHVQQCYADLGDQLAPETIRSLHTVLGMALDQAVAWSYILANPTKLVKPPRGIRREMATLSLEESRRLIAETASTSWGTLWHMLLATGLRHGEALALCWADIDFDAAVVQVVRTLHYWPDVGFVTNAPKSRSSRRSVRLAPTIVAALRGHRSRQLEARLAYGPGWEDHNLVFCRQGGGWIQPATARKMLRRDLERLGLPLVRVHDLRHTFATIGLEGHIHPKVIQEMLGHANISLTLDTYSHVAPSMHKDAATTIGELLQRGS